MTQARTDMIRQRLEESFAPSRLEIRDDSHKHAGHPGARDGRGHFHVEIISEQFAGVSRIKQHQMIYEALGALMQTDIHALQIRSSSSNNESVS